MPGLRAMMTTTASTKRADKSVAGKSGPTLIDKLSGVLLTPPMTIDTGSTQSLNTKQALGIVDSAVQLWLVYCEPHNHMNGLTPVSNALPDIVNSDRIIIGSTTYIVRHAQIEPASFSFASTLELVLIEDMSQ
jgi:hypothetical protein